MQSKFGSLEQTRVSWVFLWTLIAYGPDAFDFDGFDNYMYFGGGFDCSIPGIEFTELSQGWTFYHHCNPPSDIFAHIEQI